jgi:hypothetical protein
MDKTSAKTVKFIWHKTTGDETKPHDFSKVETIKYTGRAKLSDEKSQTYRELLKPSDEFSRFWRLIFAGKQLSWDEQAQPNVTINLVAQIGHWSSDSYQRNDPLNLFRVIV